MQVEEFGALVERFAALVERFERLTLCIEARDGYDVENERDQFAAFLEEKPLPPPHLGRSCKLTKFGFTMPVSKASR